MAYIQPSTASDAEWKRQVASEFNSQPWTKLNVISKTANYTVVLGDNLIVVDATAGAVTISLPSASTFNGRQFIIKKVDASANAVTIDGNGAETIDGAATLSIAIRYQSYSLVSDGTGWHII